MKLMKRMAVLMMAFVMTFGFMIPSAAFAEGEEPVPEGETIAGLVIPYGVYEPTETELYQSKRIKILCNKVHVTDVITAEITITSTNYTTAKMGDAVYESYVDTEAGTSTFDLPIEINKPFTFTGHTTAMGGSDIDYTVTVSLDKDNLKPVSRGTLQDGFYTTAVMTKTPTWGWRNDKGYLQNGYLNPANDYEIPVTIKVEGGKIVDLAYTKSVYDILPNTGSDVNYLLWCIEGHDVESGYAYLTKSGGNYETYHLIPFPAKNGKSMKEQFIGKDDITGVDTVTAATVTSRAIIDSVDKSLTKAERGLKDDPDPVLPGPDTTPDVIPEDGVYLIETVEAKGTDIDNDVAPTVLYVKDGTMTAEMGIQERTSSYPFFYPDVEKAAIAAGQDAWFVAADYDWGYKYAGSLYKNVPIKSLDKYLRFILKSKSSGNWFNRPTIVKSEGMINIPQNNDDWKYTPESFAAVKTAFDTFITVRDDPASKAADIESAKDSLLDALDKLEEHVHDYKIVEGTAKPATCEEAGKGADQKCECGAVIQGAVIPALGHDYHEVEGTAKAATCEEAGKGADQQCSRCDSMIPGAVIPPLGHTLVKTDAKAATDKAEGNIEYWKCDVCGKYFSDADGKTEITEADTIIPVNDMTVKANKLTAKAKKNTTFKAKRAFTVKNAKGKVTYKKAKGDKKIKVASSGKVTVKKGLKKGKTYIVKVKVTSAATAEYTALTKAVKLKIKIK